VANVQRDALDLSEVKSINCTESESRRFQLVDGDVLIVEGHASVSEIGRSAVWRSLVRGTLHQNHLIRARCSEALLPEYLNIYINSSGGQEYFRSRAKSSSGLNTINSTVVKEMPIYAPPIQRQQRLMQAIGRIDDSLRAVRNSVCELRNLSTRLVDMAFA
jgi:restriction endonuclease S subunit